MGGLWGHIRLENIPHSEQMSILSDIYPELSPLLPWAMACLHVVRRATGVDPSEGASTGDGDAGLVALEDKVRSVMQAGGLSIHDMAFHAGRHFSLRDLVKWCKRMKV